MKKNKKKYDTKKKDILKSVKEKKKIDEIKKDIKELEKIATDISIRIEVDKQAVEQQKQLEEQQQQNQSQQQQIDNVQTQQNNTQPTQQNNTQPTNQSNLGPYEKIGDDGVIYTCDPNLSIFDKTFTSRDLAVQWAEQKKKELDAQYPDDLQFHTYTITEYSGGCGLWGVDFPRMQSVK